MSGCHTILCSGILPILCQHYNLNETKDRKTCLVVGHGLDASSECSVFCDLRICSAFLFSARKGSTFVIFCLYCVYFHVGNVAMSLLYEFFCLLGCQLINRTDLNMRCVSFLLSGSFFTLFLSYIFILQYNFFSFLENYVIDLNKSILTALKTLIFFL